MTQALLNALPEWALFILFVIVPVVLTLLGSFCIRKFLPHWKRPGSEETVGIALGVLSTFFALVLAFAIVNLYQRYDDASYRVDATASALIALSHDAGAFPAPEQRRINLAIVSYSHHLTTSVFPGLREGTFTPGGNPGTSGLYLALQSFHPQSPSEVGFYDASINEIGTIATEEQQFTSDGSSALPGAFAALLVATGLLTLCGTFVLVTQSIVFENMLSSVIAAVIGMGWLTVAILEYPFSGSVAVSTAAFTHGYLSSLPHLLR